MKIFDPQVGGHRFRNDDLMLMETAYREALQGLISALNPSMNVVLSGLSVSITGSNINVTSGFASFKGEVFSVEGITIPYQADPARLFLKIDQTVLPPSPVSYQDTQNKNVHFNRVLDIKYFDSNDVDINLTNGIYLDEIAPGGFIQKGIVLEFYPSYIGEENDLFDQNGAGRGRMLGYHICNGRGATPDLRGQFTFMHSSGVGNDDPLLPNTIDGIAVGQRIGNKQISILKANLPNYNLTITDNGHNHPSGTKPGKGNRFKSGSGILYPMDYQYGRAEGRSFTADEWTLKAFTNITVSTDGGNQPIAPIPSAYAMIKIMRII